MTTYRIEFDPAWPVPPITVDFTNPAEAAQTVGKHAIPYLAPILAKHGHPEYADCLFRTNRDRTIGDFMWIDLASDKAAHFCCASLTATPGGAA